MNTTARIEQTCEPGRIQLSSETAEMLYEMNKDNWIEKRSDTVQAKGKGFIQTWWLTYMEEGVQSRWTKEVPTTQSVNLESFQNSTRNIGIDNDPKIQRLVDWNVEVLVRLLKQIVAQRAAVYQNSLKLQLSSSSSEPCDAKIKKGDTFLDEVKEIIELPRFDASVARNQQDVDEVTLPTEAVLELKDYVMVIASLYRQNPFHSFEHASHVVMSTVKLLSRIVAPSELEMEQNLRQRLQRASNAKGQNLLKAFTLHDHTFGIASFPYHATVQRRKAIV